MWADLFLASGGVINFNNGDVTLTHAANSLSVAGGDFNVEIIDGQTINFDGDGSPTADLVQIGSGDTSATDGVDALQLTFAATNASGNVIDITPSVSVNATDAFNVIDVDAFTATISADGTWTASTVAAGIQFGTDANAVTLYRSANDTLKSDDQIEANTFESVVTTSTNVDAAGTTTLFARLAQIDDTDVGDSADTGADATLFGRLGDNNDSGQCSTTACTNETLFGVVRNLPSNPFFSQFAGYDRETEPTGTGTIQIAPGIHEYTTFSLGNGTTATTLQPTSGTTRTGLFLFIQGTLTVTNNATVSVLGFGANGRQRRHRRRCLRRRQRGAVPTAPTAEPAASTAPVLVVVVVVLTAAAAAAKVAAPAPAPTASCMWRLCRRPKA